MLDTCRGLIGPAGVRNLSKVLRSVDVGTADKKLDAVEASNFLSAVPNGTDAQRWRVSHDEKSCVTLTDVGSGKALDVLGGVSSAGSGCGVFSPNGTRAQKWVAVRDGSSVKLVSALDDRLVLDARDGRTSNGARAQIFDDNGTPAQRWLFSAEQPAH